MAAECPEQEEVQIESELAALREQVASTSALLEEEPAPLAPDVMPPTAKPKLPSDPAERVQAAERLRTQGNAKFQARDIAAAQKEYEEALRHLGVGTGYGRDPNIDADSNLAERSKACRIPAQLNLALCCLRIEPCQAFRALELCEGVLDEEPDNAKATYRKAKALLELGELKEAEYEFIRACKLMPKDATVRNDLEALRRRVRESREQEKRTFEGFLDRGPGFASDGRTDVAQSECKDAGNAGKGYELLCNPDQNPYVVSQQPGVPAELMTQGKLEEALFALEAALIGTAARKDWNAHFEIFLELGRFFMDLNIDRLAILCINHIIQARPLNEPSDAAAVSQVPPLLRRHALLLSGICLLNEAEEDPQLEVSQAIELWLAEALSALGTEATSEAASLQERLQILRDAAAPQVAADAAVAHGLLRLVSGLADVALQDFAGALRAPEDEACFFGNTRRLSTKWNMLGAVLANRGRHEHALLAYERALRLQLHYPRALNNQGIAFQARGAHVEAAAAFAQAIAVVPQWCSPALWPLLIQVAEQSGNIELAEAAGQKNLSKVQQILLPASSAREAAEDLDMTAVLERIGV